MTLKFQVQQYFGRQTFAKNFDLAAAMAKAECSMMSVFSDAGVKVAKEMLEEDKGLFLVAPTKDCSLDIVPEPVRFNEAGRKVQLVVIIPKRCIDEYEVRVAVENDDNGETP